jgi:5-(carboxyamino)imidazole ribonucleotide mutase
MLDGMSRFVAILMGSESDRDVMKRAEEALAGFGVPFETNVLSAHRMPRALVAYVEEAERRGAAVFICAAGMAAALPGVVAAHTAKPVIGVPISSGGLGGLDSLLSIVQMPKGVPVATVAINGAQNAALLAVQILATADAELADRFGSFKAKQEGTG